MSQNKYSKNIVKKFGFESEKHKCAPTSTHIKLTKDDQGINMDQSIYRSMIGSLMYLIIIHPYITFLVRVYARYQAKPKTSHLTKVKRIIKYINGTSDYVFS